MPLAETEAVRVLYSARIASGTLLDALERAGLYGENFTTVPDVGAAARVVFVGDAATLGLVLATLDPRTSPAVLVAIGSEPADQGGGVPCLVMPELLDPALLAATLRAAAELVRARARSNALARRLADSEERIAALNRIGIALSAERDVDKLLVKILTESRRFSRSEAGSLYLVEDGPEGKRLRFKLAQNDAVVFSFSERTVAVDDQSLAGYAAFHGEPLVLEDAYELPEGVPYQHNDSFDVATGWRTRAVLIVPMKDHRGELVGVLQLMNRQGPESGTFEPYPADLVPVMLSLATQAAVCLKANQLTASIRRLFEDFARAAIVAVEQRDPTTAGHSNRVAELTVSLAKVVDRASEGPYARVSYSREELREISTAALLHDFGKISIPERVLIKAKKLEPDELRRIRDRFDFALESGDADGYRRFLHALVGAARVPSHDELESFERVRLQEAQELEGLWREILKANEPTILPEATGQQLRILRDRTFRDRRGESGPLLLEDEFQFLSISRGSLSADEREKIESHVSHTYRFLATIPWTADLARVPDIAHAHHEKLDGSGYPRQLTGDAIPISARLLTVCDIYDALTAADRPYKKAVPRERALKILEDESTSGKLDPWLVQTFISERVWLSTEGKD
ncbi:MAG: HD domain-containing phosphohydrolase [Thermoanaerobaculia bacterium]